MENDSNPVKSRRTSPYLQKPIRSLEEARAQLRRPPPPWDEPAEGGPEAGERLDNDAVRLLRSAEGGG